MRLDRTTRNQFQQREMRTFGRKNGYVTTGQRERMDRLLPQVLLPRDLTLPTSMAARPVVLEIGFGNGDFLANILTANPEWQALGIEIYLPGVAKTLTRLEEGLLLERVRISTLPAQYVVAEQIPEGWLHGIFINHPDPWPKLRHHNRRLIQPEFAALLASRLEVGGFIQLASDKPDLAEWMRRILDATPGLTNLAGEAGFVERSEGRVLTKFEQRGLAAGRISQFLHYVRI